MYLPFIHLSEYFVSSVFIQQNLAFYYVLWKMKAVGEDIRSRKGKLLYEWVTVCRPR